MMMHDDDRGSPPPPRSPFYVSEAEAKRRYRKGGGGSSVDPALSRIYHQNKAGRQAGRPATKHHHSHHSSSSSLVHVHHTHTHTLDHCRPQQVPGTLSSADDPIEIASALPNVIQEQTLGGRRERLSRRVTTPAPMIDE
jgi:hypothetical protein